MNVPKRMPSLICYVVAGKRFEKKPDATDLARIEEIAELPLPSEVPIRAFPYDEMWEAPVCAIKVFPTHITYLSRVLPKYWPVCGRKHCRVKTGEHVHMLSFLYRTVNLGVFHSEPI